MNIRFTLILLLLTISFLACENDQELKEKTAKQITTPSAKPTLRYEIAIDSLDFQQKKIGRNENLSDILNDKGISYQKIYTLVENAEGIFDVRKIRKGNPYYLFTSQDSAASLQFMVYEKSKVEYIVFSMADLKVWKGKKEIKRVLDTVSATITSSLWMALYEQGQNPALADELADIYSWTIDFFGIQKGDYFKVYFEHLVVEDDTIGIGQIFAANFNHANHNYQAYYYVQDSIGEFFDEEGGSLRKTFLKAPLRFKRISSKFSHNRYHPVLKIYRPHHGIDYAAATGTPVYTIGDGKVIKKGYQKRGGGNYVKIKHNSTYTTVYMHLNGFAKGLHTGQHLKQGDLIGYVGATGLATGPHLDFRVYKNGSPINPLKMKSTPAKPVKDGNIADFGKLKESLIWIVDN